MASGVSDPNGFYQIALEPGDYIVCAEFRRCTAVTVDPNARQRLDYDSTDGHGWSNTGVPAPCP
ncbi:MAG: carboxypeptidase regulatory-like domain-containing protein [Myxococcales bacterium]|nr:carboxypeptidase regulatory-like domain-containing protein [Myxococcales bacterium]